MMWKLDPPDISECREELDIVFAAELDLDIPSDDAKNGIVTLYEQYCANFGRPSEELIGVSLSEALRQAVHDAYSQVQDRGKLSKLRQALKLLAVECPYCGFGQIQDLDHHLPKNTYQVFSIFAMNLIPCCATCNRSKPRKPRMQPERHLIHPYLEDVSKTAFLRAEVLFDEDESMQVSFVVKQTEDMDAELHSRLLNHMKEFKLHERYSAQVNIYLAALETGIEMSFTSGGAKGLRDFLLISAEKNSKRFGINDWRTALLSGLAASKEFCKGGFAKALGY